MVWPCGRRMWVEGVNWSCCVPVFMAYCQQSDLLQTLSLSPYEYEKNENEYEREKIHKWSEGAC